MVSDMSKTPDSSAPAPSAALGVADNPLLAVWSTPFETPPFDAILPEHFLPALEAALQAHGDEIAVMAGATTAPDFANVVEGWERSGRQLQRVASVFYALVSAHSNPALLAIEGDVAMRLARHWNAIYMNAALFARVDSVHARRAQLRLSEEQTRLLERIHLNFRRAGAALDEKGKARMAQVSERLAQLGTSFSHHLLKDEQDWSLVLGEDDLAGLSPSLIAAMRAAATERKQDGKMVVTLSRSLVEPFLQSSARRDLREKVFKAFIARGDHGGESDNNALIGETLSLREEYARLLGYADFAQFKLDDTMAKTPQAVRDLLERVWAPARKRALGDRDALQDLIAEEGGNFKLAAWDWRYYAEKLRKLRADFDEAQIKPYFTLDNMIAAAFETAHRLFGLTFAPRKDVPVWHKDVLVWEVRNAQGQHVGLFYGDYFARSSKRSGAWMTSLRDQQKLDGAIAPLILNVMNFAKGADGEPSLLSADDARTLFHEFGHGLHGLLSNVTYPSLSGTSVFTDFVELPSQLYEHWQERPEILRQFARHFKTNEALPDDLLQKFLAARKFNQGFATVEFLASALLDLEFHSHPAKDCADVGAFERKVLDGIGMPGEIAPRHRPTQFGHVFSGDGYASGYYSYMWSEVMDADAFGAFEEAGDIFDTKAARKLHDNIYSTGGARDPAEAYRAFRGREPDPQALLRRRGLIEDSPAGDVAMGAA